MSGKHICTASSRITDVNNVGEIILSSHREAQNADINAQKHLEAGKEEGQAVTTTTRPTVPPQALLAPEPAGNPSTSTKRKSPPIIKINSDHDSDTKIPQPCKRKKKGNSHQAPLVIDSSDSGGDEAPVTIPVTMQDKSHNINMWEKAPLMQALHTKYCKWAMENSFESKLPKDIAAWKEAQAAAHGQLSLDPHLKTQPLKECVIAYSDSLFCLVAIEWLIATDQLISALEHPKFIKMIDVASQATNGVKIPN
ncbi:hypothetical protein DXG01_004672 [Tephrocybe rancida]|nr:hypothetical protein DXG01_004672 [Tephrocybe rancida]